MKTKTAESGMVKRMREIRDELSLEIKAMTYEQEKDFLKRKLAELKMKKTESGVAV